MALCRHFLPGFKATCLGVGAVFVLLAGSELAQGVPASMSGFGIPDAVLTSPHYQDAMGFVFVHMLTLGVVIATVGAVLEAQRARRVFARVMALTMLVYAVLDVHTSDSALGNHLYLGARTLVPPVIDVVVMVLFAHVGFCRSATEGRPAQK